MVLVGVDKVHDFLHSAKNKMSNEAHKIGHDLSTGFKKVDDEAKKVGREGIHEVESGVKQAGVLGSDLEKDLLPSSTSIIEESGIVLLGLGVIAVLALKFL
jgi:hypothetical protein